MVTLVEIQQALALGQAISPSTVQSPPFSPNRSDVWINTMWITSLSLGLMAALLAVLVKQWLLHYNQFIVGSARDRMLLRQFRLNGLTRWRVPAIIGILPYFLHIALLIFFAGLCLFARALHSGLFVLVLALTIITTTVFILSHVVAIVFPSCPYRNPFVTFAYYILRLLRGIHHALLSMIRYTYPSKMQIFKHWLSSRYPSSMKEVEKVEMVADRWSLLVDALIWLSVEASDPTAQESVSLAPAGLLSVTGSNAKRLFEALQVHYFTRLNVDFTQRSTPITNEMVDRALHNSNSLERRYILALCSLYPQSQFFHDSPITSKFRSQLKTSTFQPDMLTYAGIAISRSTSPSTYADLLPTLQHQILANICADIRSFHWCQLIDVLSEIRVYNDPAKSDEFPFIVHLLCELLESKFVTSNNYCEDPCAMVPFRVACREPYMQWLVLKYAEMLMHNRSINGSTYLRQSKKTYRPTSSELEGLLKTVAISAAEHKYSLASIDPWDFLFSGEMLLGISDDDISNLIPAIYLLLGNGGAYNNLQPNATFQPTFLQPASVGVLCARWLNCAVDKKVEHHAFFLEYCSRALSHADFLLNVSSSHDSLSMKAADAIDTIFTHLSANSATWHTAQDNTIFQIWETWKHWITTYRLDDVPFLDRKFETLARRRGYDKPVSTITMICGAQLHYSLLAPLSTGFVPSDFPFLPLRPLLTSSKRWQAKVYISLLDIFQGVHYQKRLTGSQRVLLANMLFDVKMLLMSPHGLGEVRIPLEIYVYEGEE